MFAQNFGTGSKWLPSVVLEVTGPVSFLVKLQDGRLVRRHKDHLRHQLSSSENEVQVDDLQNTPSQEEMSKDVETEIPIDASPSQSTVTSSPDSMESTTNSSTENAEQSVDAAASSVGAPTVNEQPSGTIHIETNVPNSQPAIVNAQPTIGTAKNVSWETS